MTSPIVTGFFDRESGTISYVVADPAQLECAVIDSVMDFDYAAARLTTRSADAIIAHVREQGLSLAWLIETHVHADHLSAAPYIQSVLGGRIGIGAQITEVQHQFGEIFGEGPDFPRNGSQFGRLFTDGDSYRIGALTARVIATPGHTPVCTTHIIGDAAFVGDTLFMPDSGTARADFPGGDARQLYRSIRHILDLPPATRMFVCHDYSEGGRTPLWETTVAEQRASNTHVRDGISEEDFYAMRTARDARLAVPRLIIPAIQVNMRAGNLPNAPEGERPFLRVPIGALGNHADGHSKSSNAFQGKVPR